MLKHSLSILVGVLALKAGSLFALVHPPIQWAVAAEYLYWRPDVDDTIFILEGDLPPTVNLVDADLLENPFGFHSGFRIEGAYLWECLGGVHLRYSRLRATTEKTVFDDDLRQAQGPLVRVNGGFPYIGYATSDLTFSFQNVEALLSRPFFMDGSSAHIYLFAGLQYFHLSLNEDLGYVQTVGGSDFSAVHRRCRDDGIGPELGWDLTFPILCFCQQELRIATQGYGALLSTKSQVNYTDSLNGILANNLQNPDIWRLVPACNVRVGLSFVGNSPLLNYFLEVGYEMNVYFKAIMRDEHLQTLTQGFYNANMQGLYVSAGLVF